MMAAQPQQAGIQSAAGASKLKPRPFSEARPRQEVGRAEESAGQCLPHMKDHFTCIGNKTQRRRRPFGGQPGVKFLIAGANPARQQGSKAARQHVRSRKQQGPGFTF